MELINATEYFDVYLKEMDEYEKADAFDKIIEKILELECYDSETACQNDNFSIESTYVLGEILDEYVVTEYKE